MKIAQIMLASGMGGAEGYFVALSKALAKRGHEILVVCERRFERRAELEACAGIEVFPVTVRGRWDRLALWQIKRCLNAFEPQVAHLHLARAAHLGGGAAKALGIPTITKLHNYVKLKNYQHVDWFNVTTKSQQHYLLDHSIPAERIVVIPNFSSLPAVEKPKSVGHEQALVWVSLGRLVPKKGFDLLIDAFARLVPEHPQSRMIIAGRGPELPRLQAQVDALGISESVTFPGWVTDIAAFLDQGDVFVLPSRDEPFGIVVLEAMARGLAIVSTRTQGPVEILDEQEAWLVAVDDADALYNSMSDAASSPDQRKDKADQAWLRFQSTYAEDQVVPRLERQYQLMIPPKEA